MKRSILIALALLNATLLFAPSAGAAGASPALTNCLNTCTGTCTEDATTGAVSCSTDTAPSPATERQLNAATLNQSQQQALDTAAAQSQSAAQKTATDANLGKDIDSQFDAIISRIMKLFAWLVGAAALTLDYSVYYTVIQMGTYVHNLSAIGVAWRILRDIGNIALIFGFIAIGISTILNTEMFGYGKKLLPTLLIAAVFLNFSLFFAEAVIDVGNLFATEFFTQINGGQPPTADFLQKTTIGSEGISNKIMAQVGLQSIYTQAQTNQQVFKAGNTWVIGFMSIILFIIAAFVMFSLAFILVARFIALIFLIILAPIGVAGLAIPKLANKAREWWSSLVDQTITAPVLLLMLYVALAVITDTSFLTGFCVPANGSANTNCSANYVGWVNGNFQGFASMLLTFLVAMGLLIAVAMTAKKLSATGAGWATKTAGAATFGLTAWGARNTIGLGANYFAKKARGTRLARIPIVGTSVVRGLEKTASSNFDVRGTGALKNFPGGGVDAGAAAKGGYKEELKKRTESRVKYATDLKGKEFSDLSEEQQLSFAEQESKLEKLKKAKTDAQKIEAGKPGALTPQSLKKFNEDIKATEENLDKMHREAGTERGAKLQYASILGNKYISLGGFLSANKDAAKKIKEEARKSKDDKDLESLRKALKKAGGGEEEKPKEEKKEEPKAEGGEGGGGDHH